MIIATFIVCIIAPFFTQYVSDSVTNIYSFNNATDDENELTQSDYYKIKNHILSGEQLYIFSNQDDTTLDIYTVETEIVNENSIVRIVDTYEGDFVTKQFSNIEELNKFKENYVIDYDVFSFYFCEFEDNVLFDDENLTISSTKHSTDWYLAYDVLPVYIMVACILSALAVIITCGVCHKKCQNND